jgi:hypothetical protein
VESTDNIPVQQYKFEATLTNSELITKLKMYLVIIFLEIINKTNLEF